MRHTKSQVSAHVFIYILTAVLIGVIFLYGFNAINQFRSRAETIREIQFEQGIEKAVKDIYFEFGKVKSVDIKVPAKYDEVCFVESFEDPTVDPYTFTGTGFTMDAIMDDRITENLEGDSGDAIDKKLWHKVFMRRDGLTVDSFVIEEDISVDGNPDPTADLDVLCVSALNGEIQLRLEGKGNHAIIMGRT